MSNDVQWWGKGAMEMSNTNFPTGLQSENSASRTMDVCQSGIPRRILLRSRDCTKKNLEKYRNTGWGPKDSFQLRCGCEKTMVFGRYNEPVNGVYKPTYHWGGVHVPWNTISVVSNFCIQEKSADCESWSYYGYSKHISMGYPDWKCSWIFSIGRQWRWDGIWWNHCEDYAEKPPVAMENHPSDNWSMFFPLKPPLNISWRFSSHVWLPEGKSVIVPTGG